MSEEQTEISTLGLRSEMNLKSKIQNPKWLGLSVIAFVLVVTGAVAQAQQPGKVPRIGMLLPFGTSSHPRVVAFRQGLHEAGYVEGQNIAVEYRYAEGKSERLSDLAAELVSLKVEIIVTWGEAAISAAKQATNTVPIVVAIAGDLVASGHAASLARPGGNITGLVDTSPELSGKRLELLKELVPKASRVAILWNGANPVKVLDFKETEAAAHALGLKLQSLEVRAPQDFESRFKAATTQGSGALVVLPDALTIGHTRSIVDFATKSRLPAMYGHGEPVEAGGLMAYGVSVPENFRRAAVYVDKILKGRKPADLPVEQPTKFEFVINLKAAKQIGLTIPQSVLYRADKVIK
jgi:putative ABC transport system substrate-binding protein